MDEEEAKKTIDENEKNVLLRKRKKSTRLDHLLKSQSSATLNAFGVTKQQIEAKVNARKSAQAFLVRVQKQTADTEGNIRKLREQLGGRTSFSSKALSARGQNQANTARSHKPLARKTEGVPRLTKLHSMN